MTKLTDEELGGLLRETFAGKEDLGDSLLEATIVEKRRTGPILLAAASVLVVLGGILYAVQGSGHDTPIGQATATVPGATTTAPGSTATSGQTVPENSLIWAAAIAEILKIERPAAGWPGIRILDAPNAGAGGAGITHELAKRFTEAERIAIENALSGVKVHWVSQRPLGRTKDCEQPSAKQPYITVGPIVPTQGHVEVGGNIWRGCLDAHWATYRLDKQNGTWKVTGTVGPVAVS
jgi:hypothetical protein